MKLSLVQKTLIAILFAFGCSQAAWVNATGNLANMASECGNMCLLSAVPGKDRVIAGIAQKGLWATTDGGTTWTHLGSGAGSAVITNRPGCIVYDPTNPDIFWESGAYNGNGVYKTTDGGVTFAALGSVTHCDFVAVDFTDPQRKLLLANGHEQPNKLYRSTDGGLNWTGIGANLPANSAFASPVIINTTTFVVGCSGYSGTALIARSTDGGATFTPVGGTIGAKGASAGPLVLPNGTILWELIYNNGMIRSIDNGVTWTQITGYGSLSTSHPILLPDGRVATRGINKIVASANVAAAATATWIQICDALPALPSGATAGGVIYEPVRGSFYTSFWNCGNVVPPTAISRFDLAITTGVSSHMTSAPVGRHAGSTARMFAGPTGIRNSEAFDIRGRRIDQVAGHRPAMNSVTIVKTAVQE
jgi:hypothetical protein